MAIAVVIPTCRPEILEGKFLPAWIGLFEKHDATVLVVNDAPKVEKISLLNMSDGWEYKAKEIMGKNLDLICNKHGGIRDVGFAFIAKMLPDVEYIVTLDDDVLPVGDPIEDHLEALDQFVPISWISIGDAYTRGFPYNVRKEAEVVLSHGVWDNIPDLDAPTQLIRGDKPMKFNKMVIPKNVFYPMSEMNLAFKRKALPYMYMAPHDLERGIGRCDDIFCGIASKREFDWLGWAVVSGYSTVYHTRASNVFTNLEKEAKFITLNETYWQGDEKDPYFKDYNEKRRRWTTWIQSLLDQQNQANQEG